jgi:A/G-specific adenine glycosylase
VSTHHLDDDRTLTTSGSRSRSTWRRQLLGASSGLRRDLPWLKSTDPWAILVSEVMLQQTQVARVIGPWERFLQRFPTPTSCAQAPLSEVLIAWAGLGYHRRARQLHLAARTMRDEFAGEVPNTVEALLALPGVGAYTARAVATFAFNAPVGVVDTNVGRVLARSVANRSLGRAEAQRLADELVDRNQPALWNQAMVDLGARFCRARPHCATCPVRRQCAWRRCGGVDPAPTSAAVSQPQAAFAGSDRQARGRLLARLRTESITESAALRILDCDPEQARRQLAGLTRDGLVTTIRRRVALSAT